MVEFVAIHGSPSLREALLRRDQAGYLIPGFGPLVHAALFGYDDVVAALAKDTALLKAEGGLALYVAASMGRPDTIILLLEQGVPPNTESDSESGLTALFGATEYGHTDVVCLLLKKGADVNRRARTPFTLLDLGVAEGRTETVHLLLGNGYVMQPNERERLIRIAQRTGNPEILRLLTEDALGTKATCAAS